MPKVYDDRCRHLMMCGPRRGDPCGVGCNLGGRCAKHRPKPWAELAVEGEGLVTDTCSICLEDVTVPGPLGVKTRCGHVYHKACLGRVRSNKCPNCRADLAPLREARALSLNNLPPQQDVAIRQQRLTQVQLGVISIMSRHPELGFSPSAFLADSGFDPSTVFRAGSVQNPINLTVGSERVTGPDPTAEAAREDHMMVQLAIARSLVEL